MADVGTSALTRPLDQAGWRTRTRPPTGLAHVLGAGGGAFAVFATDALVDKLRSADATFAGVGLNVALVLIALAVVLVPVGPARGAAVVALAVSTPLIWIFVFYGNGQSGSGWLRGIFLLSAAMYLGFYSLLWTRGRAVFLALALLFVASYVEFEVHRQFESPTSPPTVLAFPGGELTDPFNAAHLSSASTNNLFQRTGDDQAIAALLLGVAFLGVGGALHRKRYSGAAVPFLVVGAIEGFAAVLGPNEGSLTLGGLLAAAVGALLAFGGHGEGRRGSVWIGVIAVVVGVLVAMTDWTTDRLGLAGYSALVALGLIGAAFALGRVLGEPPDGGEATVR